MPLNWFELSRDLKPGDRVRFVDSHDIFPMCIVPVGTLGTVTENSLNEICCGLLILPDDERIRLALAEWDGCIILGEQLDPGADLEADAPDDRAAEWFQHSPLERITDA